MTTKAIISDLASRGVHLIANGDRLSFDAPTGAMTEPLRALLKANKAALLAALALEPASLANMQTGMSADTAAELQYLFDEQCGRLEFDSGYPRGDAERLALAMLPAIVTDIASENTTTWGIPDEP